MTSTPPPLSSLLSLYWSDLLIRRAANMAGFGVMVAVGMYWVSQPFPQPEPPIDDNSFDVELAKCAAIGGIVLFGVALLILLMRWMRVRRIFTEGTVIKRLVEDIEVVTTTWTDSESHTNKRRTRHSYYATLRYEAQGEALKVRVKMPNSVFVYGLVKRQETDLMVHDSMPNKPLICSVYLKRS